MKHNGNIKFETVELIKPKGDSFGYIVGEFGKGGQETQLMYLVSQMQKEGRQCSVIVWSFDKDKEKYAKQLREKGVRLLLFNNKSILEKLFLAKRFLSQNNAIVLHSFSHYLNFYTWCISIFSKTIPIGGVRGRLDRVRKEYGAMRFWLNSIVPLRKISNNQQYRNGKDSPFIPLAYKTTKIINNHLDISQFNYTKPIKDKIINTASIGRLYPPKSIDVLILAIHHLVKKGYNIKHYHAGKGKLQSHLEKLVMAKGIEKQFSFVGEIDDVSKFLKDKYLFVLSSSSEGYPNVVMEAMACGKAIVSTNCGDVQFLVNQGKNGFIVPVGNFRALADAIEKMINNQSIVEVFSKNSRQIAEKKFNLSHYAQETLNAYSQFGVKLAGYKKA